MALFERSYISAARTALEYRSWRPEDVHLRAVLAGEQHVDDAEAHGGRVGLLLSETNTSISVTTLSAPLGQSSYVS